MSYTRADAAGVERRTPDTLFALASGGLPAAIAVIRVTGPASAKCIVALTGRAVPDARRAVLRGFRDPSSGAVLDEGLLLWMPAPASFTGEDSVEFHLHGGPAVAASVLSALGTLEGCRQAQAGEFTRRAFDNGRLDLSQVEGLADLLAAETSAQQRLALAQAGGALRERLEDWRSRLIDIRAAIEADFDFADEDDVPDDVARGVGTAVAELALAFEAALGEAHRGEIMRGGFRVVLLGEPNAGKSSLLNALARREAAIVSPEPGTTRDPVEVRLDLRGQAVIVTDTAGLREAAGPVEAEGMRRSLERARDAHLVVVLEPPGQTRSIEPVGPAPVWRLVSKDDDGCDGENGVSVLRPESLLWLEERLAEVAGAGRNDGALPLITQTRHRELVSRALNELQAAQQAGLALELVAEHLRRAGDRLAAITGRIGTEEVLGAIFSRFCIGK